MVVSYELKRTWPVVEWFSYNKHCTIRGIYVGTGLKTVSVNSQQGFLHNKKNIYPLLHSLSSGMPQDIDIFSKMWGYLLVRNCTFSKKTSCGTPLCAISSRVTFGLRCRTPAEIPRIVMRCHSRYMLSFLTCGESRKQNVLISQKRTITVTYPIWMIVFAYFKKLKYKLLLGWWF